MKLANAEDVLIRMQLQNMVGASSPASINSALDSATPTIESILRTTLPEKTRIEYFDNRVGQYDSAGEQTLYLNQQYLTSATVEVYNTDSNNVPLTDVSGLTPIDSSYYFIDRAKGSVRILGVLNTAYAGIAVKYTAGFKEGSSSIPLWMKEAAISAAVFTQHSQAVTHSKKDMPDMSKSLAGILYTQLNEHIFTPYGGIFPVHSEVV